MEAQSLQWSGKPSADDFDDYYFSVIVSNIDSYKTFLKDLDNIEALLNIDLDSKLQQQFLRLLYANVVTALETFLSDTFINKVIGNSVLLRKFVETNPDFRKRKLTLSKIFTRMDDLEKEIRNYLLNLIWHNLEKIKPMYKTTLRIDFPKDFKRLIQAIVIRHDIVHRNGKTKEGKEIRLSQSDVEKLLADIINFGKFIDNQFEESEFNKE